MRGRGWRRRWRLVRRRLQGYIPQRIQKLVQRVTGWDGFWWIAGIAIALAVSIFLSWRFWEDLHGNQGSHSTTIRNVGLVVGGVIAILLAVWRSMVAERQTATAQQSLLNERYQKGAEMLGGGVLSVRLGGIYALQRLAEEHPAQYHVQIMRLLCAFVRHPTKDGGGEVRPDGEEQPSHTASRPQLREDVQAAMTAIAPYPWINRPVLERNANFRLDLNRADLAGVRLTGASLDGADLTDATLTGATLALAQLRDARLSGANLTRANLSFAKFTNARLFMADLTGADLTRANLTDTELEYANLSETNLSEASIAGTTSLTQAQLDQACADPDNPPKLDGIVDAETNEPLVWRGQPCRENP